MTTAVGSEAPPARPASLTELFLAFTRLALQGFGGVLAVAQRVLCEQKRWFTQAQFVELLALVQVVPGPNVCNLALMVGDRFFGWRGAFAALAGLMVAPLAIVLGLAVVQAKLAALPLAAGALKGMGAVAAGLIIGSSFKLMGTLRSDAVPRFASVLFGGATFTAVALLHWPLAWVLPGVGATACTFAWYRIRAIPAAAPARDGQVAQGGAVPISSERNS